MTTPPIPYRFEYELEVPGSPDEVWRAIATADGISAWMMPDRARPRSGGALTFHMGPMADSHGQVTGFEPARVGSPTRRTGRRSSGTRVPT